MRVSSLCEDNAARAGQDNGVATWLELRSTKGIVCYDS